MPREKTWDRKITSERQALRETARLWRYAAQTGKWKPKTNWTNDCPLCEFCFLCDYCPLKNFWGNYGVPCVDSPVSAYKKWGDNFRVPDKLEFFQKRRYYAFRIRWAALRALNDHFSS